MTPRLRPCPLAPTTQQLTDEVINKDPERGQSLERQLKPRHVKRNRVPMSALILTFLGRVPYISPSLKACAGSARRVNSPKPKGAHFTISLPKGSHRCPVAQRIWSAIDGFHWFRVVL